MGKDIVKSPFVLRGRFLQYLVNDQFKIKGIHLATAQGEVYIKLPKHLRYSSMQVLQSGAWVQVQGYQKHNFKTGERKYKALTIVPTGPCYALPAASEGNSGPDLQAVPDLEPRPASKPCKGKIRVCEKSSCRKRGSKAVIQALDDSLTQAGLREQVDIKSMGCIDKCKSGPNIVVLPDKARYSRVKPNQAAELIQQHFGQSDQSASPSQELVNSPTSM